MADALDGRNSNWQRARAAQRAAEAAKKGVRQEAAADCPSGERPAEGPPAARQRGKPNANAVAKARCRFATYNAFTDSVGRYLQPVDREVWHVVWRFADGWTNTAELRLNDIAARLNCHTRTVARSIERLVKAGLIVRLKRGTRQGGPSRYRLEPNVLGCLPRLQCRDKPRRPGNPKPTTRRSEKGKFTT